VRTTRLRITLRDVHPPVQRVIDVPAATTLPELHDLLRGVRLLRLHRGVLTPTRAAADDLEVVRRLRS
jgi:hypothetical protein